MFLFDWGVTGVVGDFYKPLHCCQILTNFCSVFPHHDFCPLLLMMIPGRGCCIGVWSRTSSLMLSAYFSAQCFSSAYALSLIFQSVSDFFICRGTNLWEFFSLPYISWNGDDPVEVCGVDLLAMRNVGNSSPILPLSIDDLGISSQPDVKNRSTSFQEIKHYTSV